MADAGRVDDEINLRCLMDLRFISLFVQGVFS